MLDFYSTLLEREQSRKEILDNHYANGTMTIIGGIVLVNFYFLNLVLESQDLTSCQKSITFFVLILSLILFAYSIHYFLKAYNNWFDGYNYLSLPKIKNFRSEQKRLVNNEGEVVDSIIDSISKAASDYQGKNIKRFELYFKCRQMLIALFLSTTVYITLYYSFKYIKA